MSKRFSIWWIWLRRWRFFHLRRRRWNKNARSEKRGRKPVFISCLKLSLLTVNKPAVLDVPRVHAAISPDNTDERNIDFGKKVHRHTRGGANYQQAYQDRCGNYCIRPLEDISPLDRTHQLSRTFNHQLSCFRSWGSLQSAFTNADHSELSAIGGNVWSWWVCDMAWREIVDPWGILHEAFFVFKHGDLPS